MNKYFVIYTKRLARKLIEQGFECLGTEIDNKNPKYDVYLFEDTQEVRIAVKELTNR